MKELERYKRALDEALGVLEVCSRRMESQTFNDSVKTDILRINAMLTPSPPEMEEVEVVRWECKSCGTMTKNIQIGCSCMGDCYTHSSDDYIKLTGTLKRPKPQPVERTVSGEVKWVCCNGDICPVGKDINFDWESLVGKTGELTFTWAEGPK